MSVIKNVIVLGMHPYPWHDDKMSDTMRSMTRAFSGVRPVFINPSVGFKRALTEKYALRFAWSFVEDGAVLVCTRPFEKVPSSFGLGNVKSRRTLQQLNAFIQSVLGEGWRKNSLLYLSSGGIAQSYETMKALTPLLMAFDILDDNLAFPGISSREKAMLDAFFTELISRSTVVTAVSDHLFEKISKSHPEKIKLLPNGVDVDRYVHRDDFTEEIGELRHLERPLIGFVGAITSWIDLELLLKIADGLSRGTLVMVGPVIQEAVPRDLFERLTSHPRVTFTGPVSTQRVPHFLHQFDVLLLPRNYAPHSLASDPLKLYEYMATGKPVVSTALPSALRFQDAIYVGQGHEEILALLQKALDDWPRERSQKCRDAIATMTWENRAKKLLEWVEASAVSLAPATTAASARRLH
ncbi:glycosyltransferase [Heliobacterium undosum]|uniref:Glycosyltransferase n=1 Tax=Heliomicrobium undosum TaxID=121734 RepID=A0A845KXA4_9FIRM|nr:glycosyltransferase [Heliomicrobium undosum]MZP28137.1 glycosyltransferase [Heliomicrobium undosum]